MDKLTLKDFTKNNKLILKHGVMSEAKIKKSFDLGNERIKISASNECRLADFIAEQINYRTDTELDVSMLIHILEESSVSKFKLVTEAHKIGTNFSINVDVVEHRYESDKEVVDRIIKTLKQVKEDFDAEKKRYMQYLELKKEFGEI